MKVLSSELTQTPWTMAGKRTKRVRHAGGREEEKKQSVDTPVALQRPEALSKTEARRLHKEQRKKEVCVQSWPLSSVLFHLAVFCCPGCSGRS